MVIKKPSQLLFKLSINDFRPVSIIIDSMKKLEVCPK
jgi:hypothetical protein